MGSRKTHMSWISVLGFSKSGPLSDTLGHKSVIDKQRAAIEKLRFQNEQLKAELLLENKFSVRPGDPFAQALINKLQDEGDMLARKLVLEMRKCRMLDAQLGDIHSTLATTRSLMGGIFSAREQSTSIHKRIKLLENRLEKAYIKYNQSITHNKELREQINNLRRERIMFESIHNNLARELVKLKKDMAEMIVMANAAFEAKEKALAEMNSLKVQADREQQGFEEEWKHLTAMIEEDKRERERARAQELAMRERETQELLKTGQLGGAAAKRKTLKSVAGGGFGYNKALAQNVAAEKVEMYGHAFKKIQDATGIKEIDELVATFITAEVGRYKESGQSLDRSKSAAQDDVEGRLSSSEAQAELYDRRFTAATGIVGLLKLSIQGLFMRSGCNTPAVRDLLGEDGITDSNLLSYLGIIEQRVHELLQEFARRKALEGDDTLQEALLAHPLPASGHRIIIEPPSTTQEEEYEGIEPEVDDERPLSREHLESRVRVLTLP
ncbi:MAG: hypothetical protein WDW38_003009 [Sanguina aurantia]